MYPSSVLVFLPRSAFGLFRVCILPFIACLPLWAGEMRVRRSKTSRVEMKVDYLSLCSRGSDNPAFIWFCDFLSKASRLSCDYQSRAFCLSDGTSATPPPRIYEGHCVSWEGLHFFWRNFLIRSKIDGVTPIVSEKTRSNCPCRQKTGGVICS